MSGICPSGNSQSTAGPATWTTLPTTTPLEVAINILTRPRPSKDIYGNLQRSGSRQGRPGGRSGRGLRVSRRADPAHLHGDPPFAEGDKRRHGYSRDKRPDCVQVVIALIVTPEGFPLAYEVLAGNTSDKTTLADF